MLQNNPVRNVKGTKNSITKPIIIKATTSPFPAMNFLLPIILTKLGIGDINHYRIIRSKHLTIFA